MTAQTNKLYKGFTLIELLVVIGILAILLAITLIAINPAKQFGQANDTNRRSAITQVLNAIGQYTAENNGILPSEITGLAADTPTELADSTTLTTLCAKLVPTYLPALPVDPSVGNQAGISDCTGSWGSTGYDIERDTNNRITVSVENPYAGPIEVTR